MFSDGVQHVGNHFDAVLFFLIQKLDSEISWQVIGESTSTKRLQNKKSIMIACKSEMHAWRESENQVKLQLFN